eukprot:CAMPEP_0114693652 /NCGR_PEP_ID=MMETSP0191-20121206/69295_1 /TAXON_ID=126664 /ORGANISM="Sorites sp." /LENGTH=167 /DNA_ID=CAMNT_0001987555 /DNA_START=17 /DNA_END=520 /DNA_ORIENTATION=-
MDPAFDPSQFFKQAKKMGVHPLDFMEKKVMNPSIPGAGSSKDKKKDKKKEKGKDKKKKKDMKKKSSSSSSSSSGSSSGSSAKKRKAEEELTQYQMRIAEARQKQAAIQELEEMKAQRRAAQEAAERASRQRMVPMRPEEGHAMARQIEQQYFSQFKVMGGKQMPEPS